MLTGEWHYGVGKKQNKNPNPEQGGTVRISEKSRRSKKIFSEIRGSLKWREGKGVQSARKRRTWKECVQRNDPERCRNKKGKPENPKIGGPSVDHLQKGGAYPQDETPEKPAALPTERYS